MESRKGPLTAQVWAEAALEAITRGGLAAVAVEPLAARLGATKGSFYWHFRNREALIAAALDLWERTHTDAVIALLADELTPKDRMRRLFMMVVNAAHHNLVEISLMATPDHPLVRPVLARISERRVSYLVGLFCAMGFAEEEARQRSLFAYTAYLGLAQLIHATPETFSLSSEAQTAYVEAQLALLTTSSGS